MSMFWAEMVRRSVDMKRGAASTVHRAIWARACSKLRPKFPMSNWGQKRGLLSSALFRAVGVGTNPKLVAREDRDGGGRPGVGPGSANTIPQQRGLGVGQVTFQSLRFFLPSRR